MGLREDSIQESDPVLQGFEALQKRFVNLERDQKFRPVFSAGGGGGALSQTRDRQKFNQNAQQLDFLFRQTKRKRVLAKQIIEI